MVSRPPLFRPPLPASCCLWSPQVVVRLQIRFIVAVSSNFQLILTFVLLYCLCNLLCSPVPAAFLRFPRLHCSAPRHLLRWNLGGGFAVLLPLLRFGFGWSWPVLPFHIFLCVPFRDPLLSYSSNVRAHHAQVISRCSALDTRS